MAATVGSPQVNPPSLGGQFRVSLAEITVFPVPKSGMPSVGTYTQLGAVRSVSIERPSWPLKDIAHGLDPSEWTLQGMKTRGAFDITVLDFHDPDEAHIDIMSFNQKRCVAKVESFDEEESVVRTVYIVDWSPVIKLNAPEGEGEATVTANGPYRRDSGFQGS